MLNQLKSISRGVALGIGVASLVLAFFAAGCGKKEEKKSEVSIHTKSQPVTTPAPQPQPRPVAPEAIEKEVAVVPEVKKEVTYDEAEAAFTERRYAEAVDLFTRYTGRKSENPWGYYMLGLSAWKAGDHATAESAFAQSLALDPKHVKSMLNLSRVLLETERPEEALIHIGSALDVDPESATAYRLQGRAQYQLGENERAIASYRSAIQLDNEDAWSMNNMALILIEQERFDEAIAPLARAIEIRGDVATFQNNLGMALERTGRFAEAVGAYEAAVALDGSNEKATANFDRLSAVTFDTEATPVDLAAAAAEFVEEIASWTDDSVALGSSTDLIQSGGDVTVPGVSDTTEVGP